MNQDANNKGIYINGKNQVIELLRHLDPAHREQLLKNIGNRNPKLAEELIQKSITFEELDSLNDQALRVLLTSFKPALIGLALKTCSKTFQKRALSVLNRGDAEEAFENMNNPIQNQMTNIRKAQQVILESLGG